ncbi:unnamed protein product [Moneuplotes crassus]|uniref:Uncharacterized protein n=1 Tax=Euplotes crassus TaxID=5936 RepID=A0AAD1XIH1_EUPCR|nr:unnamed protein product [Moneuplotes crassus]
MSGNRRNANPVDKDSDEYKAVWELETWKRAEEAKFKNHLKQIELETIDKVTKEWKLKEDKRDDELTAKMSLVENIEKKLRTKAQELQKREGKIIQVEDELKHKISEVSRQLSNKEEEILNMKKKFKEEQLTLQGEIKSLKKQVAKAKELLDQNEESYRTYRKDMEESPVSVMRTEINKKNLEIADISNQLEKSHTDIANNEIRYKKLKQECIKLRRELERQKQLEQERQAEELEKLKMAERNNSYNEQMKLELQMVKEELTRIQTQNLINTDKVTEEAKMMYIQGVNSDGFQTNNSMATSNPFASQNMIKTRIGKNNGIQNKQQKPQSRLEELRQLRQDLIENNDQIRKKEAEDSPSKDARLRK